MENVIPCFRNGNCELQSLAKEYGVDSYTYGHQKNQNMKLINLHILLSRYEQMRSLQTLC